MSNRVNMYDFVEKLRWHCLDNNSIPKKVRVAQFDALSCVIHAIDIIDEAEIEGYDAKAKLEEYFNECDTMLWHNYRLSLKTRIQLLIARFGGFCSNLTD